MSDFLQLQEPHHDPLTGIHGAGRARLILDRCSDLPRRELLYALAAESGVTGGPGLEYLARLMRWMVDGAASPVPPKGLAAADSRHINDRAVALLRPLYVDGDARLARVTRNLGRPQDRSAA